MTCEPKLSLTITEKVECETRLHPDDVRKVIAEYLKHIGIIPKGAVVDVKFGVPLYSNEAIVTWKGSQRL